MEKIIITKAIDTGRKTKDDKPVIEIETKDGRVGSAFDISFLDMVDKETELDVKAGSDYKGVKQFYFLKPVSNKKGFTKDYSFEKRKASLECSINSVIQVNKAVTTENILSLAEKYFEYLNKK